jgi:hypothetical protein
MSNSEPPPRWNRSDRSTLFRQSATIRGVGATSHDRRGASNPRCFGSDDAPRHTGPRLSPAGLASPNWWGFRWGRFLCTAHQASVFLARAVRSGPFRFGKRPPPISEPGWRYAVRAYSRDLRQRRRCYFEAGCLSRPQRNGNGVSATPPCPVTGTGRSAVSAWCWIVAAAPDGASEIEFFPSWLSLPCRGSRHQH